MKVSIKNILYLLIFFYSSELFSAEIINLRFGSDAEKNRVVIDLSDDTSFSSKVFEDKVNIKFNEKIILKYDLKKNDQLTRLNFLKKTNELSLTFKRKIHAPNIYLLKKKKNKFSRIVIDYLREREKQKIIIIDPGHGGKDSGAVGLMKQLEKNVTLEVALLLEKKFAKHKKLKVVLTRNKDQFLKLRQRTRIAKVNNADLFINASNEKNNNQIIIESHSENLLLGVLKAIRDKKISNQDVSVKYVYMENGNSKIQDLEINERGVFTEPWKDGFFVERLDLI